MRAKKAVPRFQLVALLVAAMFVGCSEKRTPVEIGAHPEGWLTAHGQAVVESVRGPASCASCHGDDYAGGASKVSCGSSGCHASYPHPEQFSDRLSPEFHGQYIAEVTDWDMTTCRSCHGSSYDGKGIEAKNCLTCHSQPEGPEACNTCHGGPQNAAPPRGLMGETSSSVPAVGAHQAHLGDGSTVLPSFNCANCHLVPLTYDAQGHIADGTPAVEIRFSDLATQSGRLTPVYSAGSCSNTYCHGGFRFSKAESENAWAYTADEMVGGNTTVDWTATGTGQALCTKCHGLPPEGHIVMPGTTCATCHGQVVDAFYRIIDKALHINGQIDVFTRYAPPPARQE